MRTERHPHPKCDVQGCKAPSVQRHCPAGHLLSISETEMGGLRKSGKRKRTALGGPRPGAVFRISCQLITGRTVSPFPKQNTSDVFVVKSCRIHNSLHIALNSYPRQGPTANVHMCPRLCSVSLSLGTAAELFRTSTCWLNLLGSCYN